MLHYIFLKKNHLDIIIPCYNPLKDWHKIILISYNKIKKQLIDTKISIILVNDGSTFNVKKTHIAFLEKKISNFSFIDLKENKGKGFALREGFKNSNSEFSIFTDIDFPYKESNLIEMYNRLLLGADIVIGIRKENYYKKVPFFRKILSKSFKKILKTIFQIPTSDTQAGLKAFSEKGKNIILKTTTKRYLFDLELIKRASKNKMIKFDYVQLDLKDNIILSKISTMLLLKEMKNLFKILFL